MNHAMKELEEFEDLKAVLRQCLDMEIILDQVIESHWDFRSKVEYWRMRSISNSVSDYVFSYEIRSSLNRLAFNLLNMGKYFLDKHYHEGKDKCFCSDLTGRNIDRDAVRKHRDSEYKENIEYVVGCKLRGGSQHQSLPVDRFRSSRSYDSKEKKTLVNFEVFYSYDELVEIGTPVKIINEVEELDLTDILDGYVFAISKMQILNRQLTEGTVADAVNRMTILRNWIEKELDVDEYNRSIYCTGKKPLNLSLEWFKLYDHLKQKHYKPIRYSVIGTKK